MELSFADIRNLRNRIGAPAQAMSMNDFSTMLNTATGTNVAAQGQGGMLETGVKNYSASVDEFLNKYAGGVQDTLGEAGAKLFEFSGADADTGRQVGRESLRGVVDFLPAIVGLAAAPFTGGASTALTYASLAASGAMGAANALEKTDSAGQTALAGALPFVGGPISSAGAKIGLGVTRNTIGKTALGKTIGAVGGEFAEGSGDLVARRMMDRIIGAASGEAAINVSAMGAGALVDLKDTGEWNNPFTDKVEWLSNLIDPTLIFGINELARPTVISRKKAEIAAEQSRYDNGNAEDQVKNLLNTEVTVAGRTRAQIDREYEYHKDKLKYVEDPEERNKLQIQLSEAKQLAFELLQDEPPSAVSTLFGEELYTIIDDRSTNSIIESVVEDGVVKDKEVKLEEVVESAEEAEALRQQGLSDIAAILAKRLEQAEEPKTEDAFRQILKDANVVLDGLGESLIDDTEMVKRIEEAMAQGAEREEAVSKAVTGVKNEVVAKTKKPRTKAQKDEAEKRKKAQQNRAAQKASESPKTGAPRKEIGGEADQEVIDFVAGQAEKAKTDPVAQQALDVFVKAQSEEIKGEERLRRPIYLMTQYKLWDKLKSELKLKNKDGSIATKSEDQLKILQSMLGAVNNKAHKPYTWTSVKESKEFPGLRATYASRDLAQNAADKIEANGKGKIRAAVRQKNKEKGTFTVVWRGIDTQVDYVNSPEANKLADEIFDPLNADDVETQVADEVKAEVVDERVAELLDSDDADFRALVQRSEALGQTISVKELREFYKQDPETAKLAIGNMLDDIQKSQVDKDGPDIVDAKNDINHEYYNDEVDDNGELIDENGEFDDGGEMYSQLDEMNFREFPRELEPASRDKQDGDVGLGLTIGKIVGVDPETGNVIVGNKNQQIAKGGTVEGSVLAKWLRRYGIGDKLWKAYQLAYPELRGDSVKAVDLIDAATKPLLRVEVHGDSNQGPASRQGEILHALEAFGVETSQGMDGEIGIVRGDYEVQSDDGETFYVDDGEDTLLPEQAQALLRELGSFVAEDNTLKKDFASQFGDIAPDNFEPFDPETGLGNVAYEFRASGVKNGGGHTDNDDTLAWVRGKYVMVNGEKVFRVDEVQSDAAARQAALSKSRLNYDKSKTNLNAALGMTLREQRQLQAAGIDINAKPTDLLVKKAVDILSGHPLLSNYETIALRGALEKARENGATKLFLPDSNTAMMTERHDATISVDPDNIVPVYNKPFDSFEEAQKHLESLGGSKIPGGQPGQDAGYYKDGVLYYNEGREVIGYKAAEPSQAPGMRAAYDERLPNIAKKLLKSEPQRGDLGRHKDSPLESPEEIAKLAELAGVTPDKIGPQREPVLFNPDGTPQTNVTGLTYDIPQQGNFGGRGDGIQQSRRIVTPKALITGILRRSGMSEQAIERAHPTIEKLFNDMGASDFDLYDIVQGKVRGAATIKGPLRALLLGDEGIRNRNLTDQEKVDALSFVAGHEIGHLTEQLFKERQLSDRQHERFGELVDWTDTAGKEDHLLAIEIALEMMPERMRSAEVVARARETAGNAEEVRANLMSMWAMSQSGKPDSMLMNLLPHQVRRGLSVVADMAKSIYGAMKGTSNVLSNFKAQSNMRANLRAMDEFMRNHKEASKEADTFYHEGRKLLSVGPQGRPDVLAYFGGKKQERDPDSVVPRDERTKVGKLFDDWVMQFDQLTRDPELRGIGAAVHDFVGGTKAAVKNVVGSIIGGVDDSGKVVFSTREGRLAFEKVRDKPALNKLASDWMRLQQSHKWTDDDGVEHLGKSLNLIDLKEADADLHQRIQNMPAKDRDAIVDVVHKFGHGMNTFQNKEALRAIDSGNKALIRSYIAAKRPELWDSAAGITELTYEALRKLNVMDPVSQNEGRILLDKVATRLEAEEFQKVMELARNGIAEHNKIAGEFATKPHFFSEIRTGKYFLPWKEPGIDGVTGGLAFENLKDAEAYERKLRERGAIPMKMEVTKRGTPHFAGDDVVVKTLADHDAKQKQIVATLGLDDEMTARIQSMFDSSLQLKRELNAENIVTKGSMRKLKPGREDLDMIQTQLAYFNAATKALHKKIFAHELQYQLSNPKLNTPEMAHKKQQVVEMVENFMKPDTKLGTDIATGNAAYFLGLNLSSHMLELTQPAFTYLPEMISRGIGFVESNRMLIKAQKEVADFSLQHIPEVLKQKASQKIPLKILEGQDNNSYWSNPEYEALMDVASKRDWISLTHAAEIVEADISGNADLSEIVGNNGRKNDSKLSKFGITPVKNFARSSLKLYQQFTEFNARVALITGYEIAKKQGMGQSRAIEYAGEFARTTTFSGGKANRPNKLFNNEGSFRTVGQALYSLQGYTFGMLSMMVRHARTGFSKKQYPNLSSEERAHARKALGTMVITQFAGAGAMGFPFAGAALAALEGATGMELEKEAVEALAGIFEEDEDIDGGLFADIVMHGAANAIAGKVLPGSPDVGSRFAIGGVMGVNSYDGFSLSQLAGPTGSVVENVASSISNAAQGRGGQAMEDIMPIAWKKAINLIRNDGELTDRNGGLLIEANAGEKLSYALGFTPQKVRKMKTFDRLDRRHEELNRQRDIELTKEVAAIYEQDPRAARAKMVNLAKNDPKVQMLREAGSVQAYQQELEAAVALRASKVAELIERKTHAKDARRSGTTATAATRENLIGAMNLGGQQSETARLMTRLGVLQRLGVQTQVDPAQVQKARLVDELMRRQPNKTRAELSFLAGKMLSQNQASQRWESQSPF